MERTRRRRLLAPLLQLHLLEQGEKEEGGLLWGGGGNLKVPMMTNRALRERSREEGIFFFLERDDIVALDFTMTSTDFVLFLGDVNGFYHHG